MINQNEQSIGIIKKQRKPFVMSPTHLLCNSQISSISYKLWGIIESKPDGWKFYWSEILKHFKEGRDAVKNAGKELEKFGYIQKKKAKKGNLFCGMDIEIFYDPTLPFDQENQDSVRITENQSPEIQKTENQAAKYQTTENQNTNKDLNKLNISKKNISNFSLARGAKKENFKIPSLEEVKKIFFAKNLKSDVEKYFIYREKSNWSGVKNLEKDIEWWENGHKEKYPHLHQEQISKIAVQSFTSEELKLEEEIKNIRSSIKGIINRSSSEGYLSYNKIFSNAQIVKNDRGFVVFVSQKQAIEFQDLLEAINVKIEIIEK
jgi:hypothetical protein